MKEIKWKYVIPLKQKNILETLEEEYCFPIPSDLKECITQNNGGSPAPFKFDLNERKGMIFGGLLSFNKDDDDSFFDIINIFQFYGSGKTFMFPFGSDPFGNFFCIQDGSVVFFDHETNNTIFISDSFTHFLNMLYN